MVIHHCSRSEDVTRGFPLGSMCQISLKIKFVILRSMEWRCPRDGTEIQLFIHNISGGFREVGVDFAVIHGGRGKYFLIEIKSKERHRNAFPSGNYLLNFLPSGLGKPLIDRCRSNHRPIIFESVKQWFYKQVRIEQDVPILRPNLYWTLLVDIFLWRTWTLCSSLAKQKMFTCKG